MITLGNAPASSEKLVLLKEQTAQRFGPAGLEALVKYPFLEGAMIDPSIYIVEDGKGMFLLKDVKTNAVIKSNFDGKGDLIGGLGNTLFKAGKAPLPWKWIAAGVGALVVVGGGLMLIKRKPKTMQNPKKRKKRRKSKRRNRA
jgi:hypothetical protein